MIVKVQLPLVTNDPDPCALIYNASRSVEYMAPLSEPFGKDLIRIMRGRPKAFFHAKLVGTILHIGDEAPWRRW